MRENARVRQEVRTRCNAARRGDVHASTLDDLLMDSESIAFDNLLI